MLSLYHFNELAGRLKISKFSCKMVCSLKVQIYDLNILLKRFRELRSKPDHSIYVYILAFTIAWIPHILHLYNVSWQGELISEGAVFEVAVQGFVCVCLNFQFSLFWRIHLEVYYLLCRGIPVVANSRFSFEAKFVHLIPSPSFFGYSLIHF